MATQNVDTIVFQLPKLWLIGFQWVTMSSKAYRGIASQTYECEMFTLTLKAVYVLARALTYGSADLPSQLRGKESQQ